MRVEPASGVHPVFSSWLERRRERVRAQLQALEDERFEDLVGLLDEEAADPPPRPRSEQERSEYEEVLSGSEELTRRLTDVRSRILLELRSVERRQGRSLPHQGRSRRGAALDGYV